MRRRAFFALSLLAASKYADVMFSVRRFAMKSSFLTL